MAEICCAVRHRWVLRVLGPGIEIVAVQRLRLDLCVTSINRLAVAG
jgi:hypothetical protein